MFRNDLSFIHKYFLAEKQAAIFFIVAGIVSLVAASGFFFFGKSSPAFFKGLSIPMLLLGLVFCAVGFTVYSRADLQRKEIAYQMGLAPASYAQSVEIPRMQRVIRQFKILFMVEALFILIAIGLLVVYRQPKVFWTGAASSLLLLSIVAGILDYFASVRADHYLHQLLQVK